MYLVDTDTVVYALNGVPAVREAFERTSTQPKAISVITYGELHYGASKSAKCEANLAKVRRVAELFPVLDVTKAVVETFGSLKARMDSKGARIGDFDLVIAATALVAGYTLVTKNERHFKSVPGLSMENWTRRPRRS